MRSKWLRPEPFNSTSTISIPAGAAACSAMAVIFEMVSSRFISLSNQSVSNQLKTNKKVGFRPLCEFVRQPQYNRETGPSTKSAPGGNPAAGPKPRPHWSYTLVNVEDAKLPARRGARRLRVRVGSRAMAQLPRSRNPPDAGRQTESQRAAAPRGGWETGSVGCLERSGRGQLRPEYRPGSEARRYSAVGRGDIPAARAQRGQRCPARELPAGSFCVLPCGRYRTDRAGARIDRGAVSGHHEQCPPDDLHRWPQASGGSESHLDGVFGGPLGGGHAGGRYGGFQRSGLARHRRAPAHRSPQNHRTLHAARLRTHGSGYNHRRSENFYPAVFAEDASEADAGYRSDRECVRERPLRSAYARRNRGQNGAGGSFEVYGQL